MISPMMAKIPAATNVLVKGFREDAADFFFAGRLEVVLLGMNIGDDSGHSNNSHD